MASSNPVVKLDREKVTCGGRFTVTLGLQAPDCGKGPADIILLVDRSGSMAAYEKMEQIKTQVGRCIDRFCRQGNRMALISFADRVTVDQPLTTDAGSLHRRLKGLCAGGSTNLSAAVLTALGQYQGGRRKVLILFTDEEDSGEWSEAMQAVRRADVALHRVGPDTAFDPDCVCGRCCGGRLRAVLTPEFRFAAPARPDSGRICHQTDSMVDWSVGCDGAALMTLTVEHIGKEEGSRPIFSAIDCHDGRGCRVCFPEPEIRIHGCGTGGGCPCCPCEPCGCFTLDVCREAEAVDLSPVCLPDQGRIIHLRVKLRRICPDRRVAVAVSLMELDCTGREYPRGRKIMTVPAHDGPDCRDVELDNVCFVVPEDPEECCCGRSLCHPRCFRARVLANYMDVDPSGCDRSCR